MADPNLFEEPLLKDHEEEVTTTLGSVYKAQVIKKVLDLLRDSTPFQVATTVIPCPFIRSFFSLYYSLLLMDFFPLYLWIIMQMSVFWACMAKYCDPWQYQLSRLSHLQDGAQDLYSKAQAESRIPDLENEVFELLQKLFEASKAREVLRNQIKKILQLEAEVANLKHTNIVQHSVH